MKEPSAFRADWKMGVIFRLDKCQALAHVCSEGKTLIQTINQLFLLELSDLRRTQEPLSVDSAVASTFNSIYVVLSLREWAVLKMPIIFDFTSGRVTSPQKMILISSLYTFYNLHCSPHFRGLNFHGS